MKSEVSDASLLAYSRRPFSPGWHLSIRDYKHPLQQGSLIYKHHSGEKDKTSQAIWINNILKRIFTKWPPWKLWTIFITNGSHHIPNQHFWLWTKMNGTQRRAHEECIVCTAVWQKHLCQAQQNNHWQVHNLNHCQGTLVWRHQLGS